MKNLSIIISLFLLIGCTKKEEKQIEIPKVESYTIEQFFDNLSVGGGYFSPDESKLLIHHNKTGIYNIYEMSVEGGEESPITESDSSSIFAISYFPNDERILFSMDNNGDEISHIYMRDHEGAITDLTPAEGAKASFAGWAYDLKSFYYLTNERDPKYFDLYELQLSDLSSKKIYENKDGMSFSGISDNKKFITLQKSNTTSDNDLYLYDLGKKELTHISEHEGSATYSAAEFSRDNQKLYYLTDEGAEFTYLMAYDLNTGEKTKILDSDWDISYAYFSYSGKFRVVGKNEDAKTTITITNMESGEKVELPDFGNIDIKGVNISRSEKAMRMTVGSSKSPNDLYYYNFESGEFTRLTNSLNPEINENDLVEAEVVRYESFDGTQIPAIYYKPIQATEDNKVPALVWVHGGPGGQSRTGFSSLIQYLVNHGYAIIAVNNRGSSGYGKTFYQMDDQNHGEGDLMDCIKAKDFLAQQNYIDTSKIGIIGGSYGGYMVMAALTLEPEAFDVGVNIFGVTNWLRTLKSIPPYWESFREALYAEMGNPFTEDSIRLRKISPLFNAENIVKPLMVLQGANDPRVLQVESDEIVEAARANEVPVEYVLFEDEGHGFLKKENQIEAYGKILEFLDQYLSKKDEYNKNNIKNS